MDSISFKNSRGITLAGCFRSAGTGDAIIMCHGLTSDKSSLGVFDKIAEALNQINFNVLNFDFSGCGESGEDIISVKGEIDDLLSATEFVKSYGFKRIGFYGHSFGTLICLKCYFPELVTMALSGAVMGNINYNWDEYYSESQLDELKKYGFFNFIDRTGKERKISGDILQIFSHINQREMLTKIKCPVLIIHPEAKNDSEEQQLIASSKRAINILPEGSELKMVKGNSHALAGYSEEVIETMGKWFLRQFDKSHIE